jgi:hypothetical protein
VLPSLAVLSARKLITQNESISYLKQNNSITQQGIGLVILLEVNALKLLLLPRDLRRINCFKVVRGPKSWHSMHMPDLPKAHQCSASSYYNIEHATPGHFIVQLHFLVNSRVFDSAIQLSISGSSCKPHLAKKNLGDCFAVCANLISALARNRCNQRTRGHKETLVISAGQIIFDDTVFGNQIHNRSVPTQAITFQRALKCLATNMRQLLRLKIRFP